MADEPITFTVDDVEPVNDAPMSTRIVVTCVKCGQPAETLYLTRAGMLCDLCCRVDREWPGPHALETK